MPILEWLPAYQLSWLRFDAIAGLTVWALLIPEAMAYATLAGVPLEAGLYAAIAPLLLYAVFGTSRHLFVGPSSTVAILSAATIAPLASDTDDFIVLTAALAIIVGVILILAGIARMGWVSNFMAEPVLKGFIIGLALIVALGQADKLFGVDAEGDNFFLELWDLVSSVGDFHLETAVIGAISLAVLFGLGRFVPRAPGALITVALGIVLVSIFDLDDEGVHIVGDIPSGLPPFGLPEGISLEDIRDLLPGAFGIVLVGYAESIAIAQKYATKYKYDIDPNQELIALGLSNAGAGLSQGFAVDGSLSKTAASDEAGVKTQMSSLINFFLVLITIAALTPLFHNLPEATLGAVVIHAVWHLIDFKKLKGFYDVSKGDFALALTCLLGVLIFDMLPGLIIAVVASLLLIIYRASHPAIPVLGKFPAEETYGNVEEHPLNETFPGLVIFRFDAELFFANSQKFRDRVRELMKTADPPAKAVLADFEAVYDLDLTAADMLKELASELAGEEIELFFARVKTPVRDMMRGSGVEDAVGPDHFYESVHAGVDDYLRRHEGGTADRPSIGDT